LRRALIRIRSVIRAGGRKRRLISTFKLRAADEWTFASVGGLHPSDFGNLLPG